MSDTTTAEDRCRSVLVGLAAGDQIGGPIHMAVRLAESLLDCGGFGPSDILNRYLAWWQDGAFDTGPVSGRALALMASGMPVQEATAQVHREFGGKTAGCNPAHRSPPLSMLAGIGDEDLPGCAMAEASLTHHDPVAGEVAAAVNKLCRALIRGAAWDVALRQCGACDSQEGPGNNGGFAPDVLRAALHFVATSACFAEALERSLVFAGPANYCPVLVGTIGGARFLARELMDVSLIVSVVHTTNNFAACYGAGRLDLNLLRLGHAWFEQGATEKVDRLLIHEFGHHMSGDHLSEEYHEALCQLGAGMKRLALEKPEEVRQFLPK